MEPPPRQLVLLRHGIALDRERAAAEGLADGARPLTQRGRVRCQAVLARLRPLDLQGSRLLSSPLLRARQTADLVVEAGLAAAVEEARALAPGADPLPLLAAASGTGSAAGAGGRWWLVGHEPDLGDLACHLIGAPLGSITLRKAGIALLARGGQGRWCLQLLLAPRSLL